MWTNRFDAELAQPVPFREFVNAGRASLLGFNGTLTVDVKPYPGSEGDAVMTRFVSIVMPSPIRVKWGDTFRLRWTGERRKEMSGRVLAPLLDKLPPRQLKKRVELLQSLRAGGKDLVLAWVRHKGLEGLGLEEMMELMPLTERELLDIGQTLESEGTVRIMTFSPLFLQSRESLDYLGVILLEHLARYHERHPEEFGLSTGHLKKKFRVHSRALAMVAAGLEIEGRIRKTEDNLALPGFKVTLTAEDDELLRKLEEVSFRGQLQSISLDELRRKFRLSETRLNRLLSVLTERRKIILGRDGFILDAGWLDDLIKKMRAREETELSVADFKMMTGLTRKYAIPLLELLDEMGVTRRRGAVREIFK